MVSTILIFLNNDANIFLKSQSSRNHHTITSYASNVTASPKPISENMISRLLFVAVALSVLGGALFTAWLLWCRRCHRQEEAPPAESSAEDPENPAEDSERAVERDVI